MKHVAIVAVITILLAGCSEKTGQDLYETAQFEERQNNLQHAKELYKELTEKYPDSRYALDASERLRVLDGH